RTKSRRSALWRQCDPRHSGKRAVSSGSRTRSLQIALRREEDAGADSVHVEDWEDFEELTKLLDNTYASYHVRRLYGIRFSRHRAFPKNRHFELGSYLRLRPATRQLVGRHFQLEWKSGGRNPLERFTLGPEYRHAAGSWGAHMVCGAP